MIEKLCRLVSWNKLGLALAPITIGIAVFSAGTPAARADFSVTLDGGLQIRVGDSYSARYRNTGIYPAQVYPNSSLGYDRGYYPGYYRGSYPTRGRVVIRNSTLINPTVIDSTIENSTLINPTIVNSPDRIRTTNRRSSRRVRGVWPGDL